MSLIPYLHMGVCIHSPGLTTTLQFRVNIKVLEHHQMGLFLHHINAWMHHHHYLFYTMYNMNDMYDMYRAFKITQEQDFKVLILILQAQRPPQKCFYMENKAGYVNKIYLISKAVKLQLKHTFSNNFFSTMNSMITNLHPQTKQTRAKLVHTVSYNLLTGFFFFDL